VVLCILACAGHRLVPDDTRFFETRVLVLGRHAAQMAQQSEFPDVSCVPILHLDFTSSL
jgi:hypothetical protein